MKPLRYRTAEAAPGAPEENLVVFLEGAQQNSRARPGPIIRQVLTAHGALDVVDYPDGLFHADQVTSQLAAHLQGRISGGKRRIIFVCVSMGGLIMHDTVQEAADEWPDDMVLDAVFIDAPAGGNDLLDPRAQMTKFFPQFWTPRWANKLVLGGGELPTHEPFESEEQEWIWRQHVESSRTFPFLVMFGGQTRYIVRHPGPSEAVLNRLDRRVFIQTAGDTIVGPEAPAHWHTGRPIVANTAFHASLLEDPTEYARCLGIAMGPARS